MANKPFTIPVLVKKAWIILGLLSLFCTGVESQNQKIADSLKLLYSFGAYDNEDELKILKLLSESHTNPEMKLYYSEILLEKAMAKDSLHYLIPGYIFKGHAYLRKGDHSQASGSFIKGTEIALKNNNFQELAVLYSNIARVYSAIGDDKNTMHYYEKSIELFTKMNDSIGYASTLENIGDHYLLKKQPDSALIFLNESGAIFSSLNHKTGIAYNLGNKGLAYAQQGKNKTAENHINQATKILIELGDFDPVSAYFIVMSDIYLEKGDELTAYNFAYKSLELAKKHGLKEQMSEAYLALTNINEAMGRYPASLENYKYHIIYRDSVHNNAIIQQISEKQTHFEIAQKQREIDLLNQQKQSQNILVVASSIALLLISLLAFGLFRRYLYIQKTNVIIDRERNRSDHLLRNILPLETAEELKESGQVKAKKFESVSVLFTDFKEFTILSSRLSPEELVSTVNFYFSMFDKIIEKYGLEKIKTIGDSYMCAGGLPFSCNNHAEKIVKAAFEIAKFMADTKASNNDVPHFDIHLGVNTGPVVAGVVGSKKFAYDIWGDTVNVASRMESSSEPGKINISEFTYELIKDSFDCSYRGKVAVKNKGTMKMYFVNNQKVKKDMVSHSNEDKKVLY